MARLLETWPCEPRIVRFVPSFEPRILGRTLNQPLAFENTPNFFKGRLNVAFRKPNLAQAVNVAEFLAAFLQEDDGFRETKLALEKSSLMNDIHARMQFRVSLFVLASQNQESDCGVLKHLRK